MSDLEHPAGHVLQAYHDGELAPAEAERIAEHCGHCSTCQAELVDLQGVTNLLADDPAPELSRTVWHRVKARRSAAGEEVRLGPAFAAMAAAACVAGLVIGIWFGPLQFSAEKVSTELAWNESTTLFDGGASTTLLDVFTTGQE